MKFSWKVFLSIISLTMLTFSVGGYFLIQSSFQSSLRQTAEMSYQENNIFRATLGASIAVSPPDSGSPKTRLKSWPDQSVSRHREKKENFGYVTVPSGNCFRI